VPITPDRTHPLLSLVPTEPHPADRYGIDTGFDRIHLVDRTGDNVTLCGMHLYRSGADRHPGTPRATARTYHTECMTVLHTLALIENSRREQQERQRALRKAADAISSSALLEWVETDLAQAKIPAYSAHPDSGETRTPGWIAVPGNEAQRVRVRWMPVPDQGATDRDTEQTAGLATITAALAVRGWDNDGPIRTGDVLYTWVYRRRVA
jgi:hypothetical protein